LIVKREKKIEKRKTVSKLADALVSQKCRICEDEIDKSKGERS
jgi:hypothetical protein